MRISIQSDIASVTRRLTDVQTKHIPRATGIALSRTAGLVAQAELNEIRRVFDRPNLLTQKSLIIRSFRRPHYEVQVFLRDVVFKGTPPAQYLLPQIVGGQRPLKRFEKALQRINVLPEGAIAVPATGAKLDAYGNMSRGQIVQILHSMRAITNEGYTTNRSAKPRKRKAKVHEYVALKGRGRGRAQQLTVGIYKKEGEKLTPVLRFVKNPNYSKRFDFGGVARRVIRQRAAIEFRAAIQDSMVRTKGKGTK